MLSNRPALKSGLRNADSLTSGDAVLACEKMKRPVPATAAASSHALPEPALPPVVMASA